MNLFDEESDLAGTMLHNIPFNVALFLGGTSGGVFWLNCHAVCTFVSSISSEQLPQVKLTRDNRLTIQILR